MEVTSVMCTVVSAQLGCSALQSENLDLASLGIMGVGSGMTSLEALRDRWGDQSLGRIKALT